MSQTDFEIGYRGATACAAAGITYRQLDYWARTGLVEQVFAALGDPELNDYMAFATFWF